MNMSLGLSLYAISGTSVFNPATLALTLWVRGSYSASPWTGTASAGSSGSRNLSEATNPPGTGSAVNGFTPADFDGSNDILNTSSITLDDVVNNNAGSFFVLFNADTAASPSGAGSIAEPYKQPGIFFENSANSGIAYNTDGVVAFAWDGSYDAVAVAASTGSWHLAQVKFDGTNLKLRVDSGSWSSVASGNLTTLTGGMRLGQNYDGSTKFDGKILEFGAIDAVLSDAQFDQIKSYVNSRYGLSL